MKFFISLILLTLSLKVCSENESLSFENPDVYESTLREQMQSFLDQVVSKKKECLARYKTLEISEQQTKESKLVPLTEEEKEICLAQLKSQHQVLLEKIYQTRESYLDYVFEMYKKKNKKQLGQELINIQEFYKIKK